MNNLSIQHSEPSPSGKCLNEINYRAYTFFYRQLDFSSEPGGANKILENEPKSCLTVA